MSDTIFPPAVLPVIPVTDQAAGYPLRRIFCVGRNYAAHAAEMGATVEREAPFYFTKSAFAHVASGATVPYAPGTADLHYEMELALYIGAPVFNATSEEARAAIWGYGCGLDMTRRDLQAAFKDKRLSWDLGKDFENSAVLAPVTPTAAFGTVAAQRIHLAVNGVVRQDSTLDDMVWKVDEIVAHLSRFYHLAPGDVILTGTPAGVGPVTAGDVITGGIDGLSPITLTIGAAE